MTPGATLRLARELEPGRYAFFCTMPASRRLAYFQLGMVLGFEVAGTSDSEPPDVDGTVTVRDIAIEVPPIEAGTQTLRLENAADDMRELKLLSLEPGKQSADLEGWFGNRFAGEPPADCWECSGSWRRARPRTRQSISSRGGRITCSTQPHEVSAHFEVR